MRPFFFSKVTDADRPYCCCGGLEDGCCDGDPNPPGLGLLLKLEDCPNELPLELPNELPLELPNGLLPVLPGCIPFIPGCIVNPCSAG